MSTVGGHQDTCGGYHEYRDGCPVPQGYSDNKIVSSHGTEHPTWYS